jgi:hypothetical protein
MPDTNTEISTASWHMVPKLLDVIAETKSGSGNGGGIGDIMVLLTLLPLLQNEAYPDYTLRLVADRKDWAALGFDGLVVTLAEYRDLKVRGEKQLQHFERHWCDYDLLAKKEGISRHAFFGKKFGVEPRPVQIKVRPDARAWARIELDEYIRKGQKIVGLFPYATSPQREWPDMHWVNLAVALKKAGHVPIVVCGPGDEIRSNRYPCMRYWGTDPARTVALMERFTVCVGNDSGLAHVAAALQRPTLVIGASSDVHTAFSFYKSAIPLSASGACAHCYWRPERGFKLGCNYTCELLAELKSDQIFSLVQKQLGATL